MVSNGLKRIVGFAKENRKETFLLINGIIGLGFLVAVSLQIHSAVPAGSQELRMAAEQMELCLKTIHDYTLKNQINTGNPEDFRNTGLIGPEWSEITTTIGDPEAKRTTLNPNFAALIAHLLKEAGVKKGDTIAIGSSASFPALFIASLSASKALGLHPLVILSFGSSSFGASNPDFNIWDIYRVLLDEHILETRPVAASFGGEDDTGAEFDQAITARIRQNLQEAGIPLIEKADLQNNRLARESFYFQGNPGRIKAFINSGGGFSNIGSSQAALNIKPGLIREAPMPGPDQQGMIHSMLKNGIPVIHLLFIKGLAQKYHLPWDPVSQPGISEQSVSFNGNRNLANLLISITGLLWFIGMLVRYRMLYNSAR